MINFMAWGQLNSVMEIFIFKETSYDCNGDFYQGNFKNGHGQGTYINRMDVLMKETGRMVKFMAWGKGNTVMEMLSIKETLRMVNLMARGYLSTEMAVFIMETGRIVNFMAGGKGNTLMEMLIKDTGRMVN